MSFFWDFLDVLSISFSTLITNSLLGIVTGLSISIITIIFLRKLYFKKAPKFIKKASGIFLGIFLFFGGVLIGGLFGIKMAINRSVRTFVYGTENAVFAQIQKSTGIDVWLPLDDYIRPVEDELEEEILLFKANASSALESNYGNAYRTVCTLQKKVVPVFEIVDEAYRSNRKLIKRFVDLDAFEQNAFVSNSMHLYNCVNTAAQKSYYNKNSEDKNVDFIENLTGIKDSLDTIRGKSIGGMIDIFVTMLVDKILSPFNVYINSCLYLYVFVLVLFIVICLIPLWIRLRKFKKGKLKVRLKSTKEKIIVTKDNLEEVLADLYPKKNKVSNKNNIITKVLSIISIIIICALSLTTGGILLICIFMAIIPARIAEKKDRNYWNWYLYGLWLFIIALIHSLILKKSQLLLEDKRENALIPEATENSTNQKEQN